MEYDSVVAELKFSMAMNWFYFTFTRNALALAILPGPAL